MYYVILAWKCLFTPLFGGRVVWGTFPPDDVTHRPNPKRTVLGLNHVIWAKTAKIGRSVRAGRMNEKKRTGQDRKKVTKGLYFTYLWRSPHWSDVHENLCSGWCSRHNHVCQLSIWNVQWLRFYRGRIFHFSYWFWMGLTTVQILSLAFRWHSNTEILQCSLHVIPSIRFSEQFCLFSTKYRVLCGGCRGRVLDCANVRCPPGVNDLTLFARWRSPRAARCRSSVCQSVRRVAAVGCYMALTLATVAHINLRRHP